MQIIINSSSLRDAIGKILSVVDKRNSRPILTHCKIESTDNALEISATDLEVSAKIKVNAEINRQGGFCINAKNFFEILREMPNDTIRLEIDEGQNLLKLKCNDIYFSLLIFKTDDFPHINFCGKSEKIEVESGVFQTFISKIIHAISSDDIKLLLNGIFLQQDEEKFRAVATDLYRLALCEFENIYPKNPFLQEGVIIPRKGINEIKKLADSFSDGKLSVSIDESFAYFSANDSYFLSVRLVSRDYPNFKSVIPQKTTYTMKVNKNTFLTALKRIRILASEKSNGIKFQIRQNYLIMSANRPSLGDATEKIPVAFDERDIDLSFNAKYLIDGVSVLEDGDIIFQFNNEASATLIKSSESPQFLGLIMPIKL